MRIEKISILFLVLILAFSTNAIAQNILLDNTYWKRNPSISDIQKHIDAGNDPAEMNGRNFNPVVYAILSGTPAQTVEFLLEQPGNTVDAITHDGRTYLHWAAMGGQIETMKLLLDKGIKTGVVDDHGYTELLFAANAGLSDQGVYDLLLTHGADIAATNHNGANAMLLLIPAVEDFEMVDYLTEKGLDIKSTDNDGNGALYYVARSGNTDKSEQLLDKGLTFNKKNKSGGNAMIAAAQGSRGGGNSLEFFQYLESKGIEPNITTNDGTTPLHLLARRSNDIAVLDYFISKGADVSRADDNGNTPLMNAARSNELNIVTYFEKKSSTINATNKKGQSALSLAVASNSFDVVNFLTENGADPTVVDNDGNSLAYYLMESYRPGNTETFEKKLSLLRQNGIDFNKVQSDGNTLFHLAVESNDLYLIKKINSLGVDVNQKNEAGTTPMQIAAMKASDDTILKYLLDIGADKSIVTDFDESVYQLAMENELLQKNDVNLEFLK